MVVVIYSSSSNKLNKQTSTRVRTYIYFSFFHFLLHAPQAPFMYVLKPFRLAVSVLQLSSICLPRLLHERRERVQNNRNLASKITVPSPSYIQCSFPSFLYLPFSLFFRPPFSFSSSSISKTRIWSRKAYLNQVPFLPRADQASIGNLRTARPELS